MQEFLSQYPGITEQLDLLKQVGLMFSLLFGALNCFMGFRLLRVWTALGGFVLGAGVGFLLGSRFLDVQWGVWLMNKDLIALIYYNYLASEEEKR